MNIPPFSLLYYIVPGERDKLKVEEVRNMKNTIRVYKQGNLWFAVCTETRQSVTARSKNKACMILEKILAD